MSASQPAPFPFFLSLFRCGDLFLGFSPFGIVCQMWHFRFRGCQGSASWWQNNNTEKTQKIILMAKLGNLIKKERLVNWRINYKLTNEDCYWHICHTFCIVKAQTLFSCRSRKRIEMENISHETSHIHPTNMEKEICFSQVWRELLTWTFVLSAKQHFLQFLFLSKEIHSFGKIECWLENTLLARGANVW